MTNDASLTPAQKLRKALDAKKAKAGHGFNSQIGAKAEEKATAARNTALAKPAFRRASKRG